MRCAIVGSRDYDRDEDIRLCILGLLQRYGDDELHIVSGGATGADAIAENMTKIYQLDFTAYRAKWRKRGNSAGPVRNSRVVADAEVMYAFYTNREKSSGTADAVKKALRKGIPVHEFDRAKGVWYDNGLMRAFDLRDHDAVHMTAKHAYFADCTVVGCNKVYGEDGSGRQLDSTLAVVQE